MVKEKLPGAKMALKVIDDNFWEKSRYIKALKPLEKLTFLCLLSNKFQCMLGVYEVFEDNLARWTGLSKKTVLKHLLKFHNDKRIIRVNDYVIIKGHLKAQEKHLNPNMKKSVLYQFADLPETIKAEILKTDPDNNNFLLELTTEIIKDLNSANVQECFKTLVNVLRIEYNININKKRNIMTLSETLPENKKITFPGYENIRVTKKELKNLIINYSKKYLEPVLEELNIYQKLDGYSDHSKAIQKWLLTNLKKEVPPKNLKLLRNIVKRERQKIYKQAKEKNYYYRMFKKYKNNNYVSLNLDEKQKTILKKLNPKEEKEYIINLIKIRGYNVKDK